MNNFTKYWNNCISEQRIIYDWIKERKKALEIELDYLSGYKLELETEQTQLYFKDRILQIERLLGKDL